MGGFAESALVKQTLRQLWPELFFNEEFGFPDEERMAQFDRVAIDMSGMLRALGFSIQPQDPNVPIEIIFQNAEMAEQAYLALPPEQRTKDKMPPIVTLEQFGRKIMSLVGRFMSNLPNLIELGVFYDHVGLTPKIKQIEHEKRYASSSSEPVRPLVTRTIIDRAPIYNKLHDFFGDPSGKGRRAIALWLSQLLLETFPRSEHMPINKRLIVHGHCDPTSGEVQTQPWTVIRVAEPTIHLESGLLDCRGHSFVCGEADISIMSYLMYAGEQSGILVVSRDGDIIQSTLSVMRDRVRLANGKLEQVGQLFVRTCGEAGRIEYLDIRGLFIRLCGMFMQMQQPLPVEQLCDPIELFMLLCFMRGNDYVQKLPGVTFPKIFDTLRSNITEFAPLLRSVFFKANVQLFRINYENFVRFVCACYRTRYNLNKPAGKKGKEVIAGSEAFNTAEDELLALRDYLSRNQCKSDKMQGQMPPDPEDMRCFAASISHTINYYTQSFKTEYEVPNAFEADENGASRHGYACDDRGRVTRPAKMVKREVY